MDCLSEIKDKLKKDRVGAFLVTNELNVRYITNFSGSESMVLITPEKEYFFTDFRYVEQARQDNSKMKIVERKTSLINTICIKLKQLKIKKLYVESLYFSLGQYYEIKNKINKIHIIPAKGIVEKYRKQKTAEELNKIMSAIKIAERAYLNIQKKIRHGVTEKNLADLLEFEVRKGGGDKSSFEIICAAGEHAAQPHARATARKLKKNESVLIDWGCCFQFYNSDLTRLKTIDKISPKLRKIYQIVLDAQSFAIEKIKPGIQAKKVDTAARDYIKKKGFEKYFGHGLGHGIGLGVHEAPFLNRKSTEILKEGMVFTVEPGIYVPGWGGIRIEDMVLVTCSGFDILSTLPNNLSEIGIQ